MEGSRVLTGIRNTATWDPPRATPRMVCGCSREESGLGVRAGRLQIGENVLDEQVKH
jgi:hypothetical protein